MNLNNDRKPIALLFDPFVYIAGAKALFLGLGAILIAGLIGFFGNTHFDGVLDTHLGAPAPLWFFLSEGMIDWLSLALALLVMGRLVSKTSFRTIDLLGTQALARWPTILCALITLPKAVARFGHQLLEHLTKPGTPFQLNISDAAISLAVVAGAVVLACWMVFLMYKSYSVSCNVKGGKAIGTFIGGLLLAEILSKIALYLLSLALLAPAATGHATSQIEPPSSEIAASAAQFVDLLVKEDFAGAVARFDATMKTALPEPKLRETWQALLAKTGPFQKQLGARATKLAGYDVVLVTCQFERTALDTKVVFDAKGRVAGLFFVPSHAAAEASGPPPYARTNALREKEFTVGRGEWRLPGTLTLPSAGKKCSGINPGSPSSSIPSSITCSSPGKAKARRTSMRNRGTSRSRW